MRLEALRKSGAQPSGRLQARPVDPMPTARDPPTGRLPRRSTHPKIALLVKGAGETVFRLAPLSVVTNHAALAAKSCSDWPRATFAGEVGITCAQDVSHPC